MLLHIVLYFSIHNTMYIHMLYVVSFSPNMIHYISDIETAVNNY